MPRAKKRCPQPQCPQYAPCPTHKVWRPSSGTRPLPSNWGSLKKKARGYADKRCYVCGKAPVAGQVDHVINRAAAGSDDPSNLAWICHADHKLKTEREKQVGRQQRRAPGR